jgi:hypothetical protein
MRTWTARLGASLAGAAAPLDEQAHRAQRRQGLPVALGSGVELVLDLQVVGAGLGLGAAEELGEVGGAGRGVGRVEARDRAPEVQRDDLLHGVAPRRA